jgi:hypothetical protein
MHKNRLNTNTLKDAQHHDASEKCKLKAEREYNHLTVTLSKI